jgi:hypothetical protein
VVQFVAERTDNRLKVTAMAFLKFETATAWTKIIAADFPLQPLESFLIHLVGECSLPKI